MSLIPVNNSGDNTKKITGNDGSKKTTTTYNANKPNNIDLTKKSESELLANKLGISLEQLQLITIDDPSFLSKKLEEQQNIVQTKFVSQSEVVETESEKRNSIQNEIFMALVQNFYEQGLKDRDGKQILEPNGTASWAQLTDAQKAEFAQKVGQMLQDYGVLARLDNEQKEKYSEIYRNSGVEAAETAQKFDVSMSLTILKAATHAGISIQEFKRKSEFEKADIIESYLKTLPEDQLSEADRRMLKIIDNLKATIGDYIKKLNPKDVIDKNLSAGEILELLKTYNLSADEICLEALEQKQKKGELSAEEEVALQKLKDKIGEPSGKLLSDKARAARLPELEAQYNELKAKAAKGTLTEDEQKTLERLEFTLNSDETKRLKSLELCEAKTPEEKKVKADIDAMNEKMAGRIDSVETRAKIMQSVIDKKTEGMSHEQKRQYIINFLRLNNDVATVDVYKHYLKQGFDIVVDVLMLQGSYSVSDMNIEQLQKQQNIHIKRASENPEEANAAQITANNTMNKVPPSPETDAKRHILGMGSAKVADITGSTEVLKSGLEVSFGITDADLQMEVRNAARNSKAYNDEVGKFELDNLDKYHEQNRLAILENVIEGNEELANYASESGAVNKLATKDQVEGFNKLNNELNDSTALRNLANQISSCDAENQTKMLQSLLKRQDDDLNDFVVKQIKYFAPTEQVEAAKIVCEECKDRTVAKSFVILGEIASPDVKAQVKDEAKANVGKMFAKRFAEGKLSDEELASLSGSEKRAYYQLIFQKAGNGEKIALIKEMGVAQRQVVFAYVAQFEKSLLADLIKEGFGQDILELCEDPSVQHLVQKEIELVGTAQDKQVVNSTVTSKENISSNDFAFRGFNDFTFDPIRKHGNQPRKPFFTIA